MSIDLANGDCVFVSVMRWVEGEHADEKITEDQVYKELAKLHTVSQVFQLPPEFTRPIWGEDSFKQSMARLREHYHRFLTDEEFVLYQGRIAIPIPAFIKCLGITPCGASVVFFHAIFQIATHIVVAVDKEIV